MASYTTDATTKTDLTLLLVGAGGREHALAWKLSQSPLVKTIFLAPGNGGTAHMAGVHNVAIAATDINGLLRFAQANSIDLTIVGPEAPLAQGIVDKFTAAQMPCFGPTQAAAQLESSKGFAKQFMRAHDIPTAAYQEVTTLDQAEDYIDHASLPMVLKADGLAQGKGVIITHDKEYAKTIADEMLSGNAFGAAGKKIIFEQFLEGQEVSFIVLTDGTHAIPFASAQDYKRRNVGNTGPNTGGMGAHSPAPCMSPELHDRVMREIIEPTITGMRNAGTPYVGFLYAGLMITPEGDPKVIEFNCRFGDPEAQVIIPRMQSDLLPLLLTAVHGSLNKTTIAWSEQKAVTIVVADGGYPTIQTTGQPITIIAKTSLSTLIFHAGTTMRNEQLVTNGGRIITVTGLGDSFDQARTKAYNAIQTIHIGSMYYRTDIGIMI